MEFDLEDCKHRLNIANNTLRLLPHYLRNNEYKSYDENLLKVILAYQHVCNTTIEFIEKNIDYEQPADYVNFKKFLKDLKWENRERAIKYADNYYSFHHQFLEIGAPKKALKNLKRVERIHNRIAELSKEKKEELEKEIKK